MADPEEVLAKTLKRYRDEPPVEAKLELDFKLAPFHCSEAEWLLFTEPLLVSSGPMVLRSLSARPGGEGRQWCQVYGLSKKALTIYVAMVGGATGHYFDVDHEGKTMYIEVEVACTLPKMPEGGKLQGRGVVRQTSIYVTQPPVGIPPTTVATFALTSFQPNVLPK